MTTVKNIAIVLRGVEGVVELSKFLAHHIPYAVYHVISITPSITSRSFYTKLFKDTLSTIANEIYYHVEMVLNQFKVLAIRRVMFRTYKEMIEYLEKVGIDLVSIPREPMFEEFYELDRLCRRLIEKPIPLLIHPAIEIRNRYTITVISRPSELVKILSFLKSFLEKERYSIDMLLTEELEYNQYEMLKEIIPDTEMSMEILPEDPKEVIEYLENALKKSRFIAIDRAILGRIERKRWLRKRFDTLATITLELPTFVI